ncbi:DUF2730 family protein [Billgrantia gudaonensis]|uniref:DUF2730 family protein n=1 Tax=Billgrantia gudaonensis TaxID=376427 RepID=A0A1G9AW44_9GAMM|nr:DUF2730 family protein [Halomonas gudaonensis]SDK31473.1 Protein of unknown function [Halomonas gudaonensis]
MIEAIDWNAARFFFDITQLIGLVLLGVYTHITQRSKANSQAITSLDREAQKRLEEVRNHIVSIERRVDVVENQIGQAPTHHDLAILHKRVTQAASQMESLAGEFRATNRQLGLIHEHLLNDKRGD